MRDVLYLLVDQHVTILGYRLAAELLATAIVAGRLVTLSGIREETVPRP